LILQFVKAHFHHKSNYENIENKLTELLKDNRLDSFTKWRRINAELVNHNDLANKNKNDRFKYTSAELCLMDIKLNILYPRLDINVSKHINHLLKSPFCVHPKTGLISVPLSEEDIINFNLENIPSIEETLDDFMENR
jgi:DNA primase small subunit